VWREQDMSLCSALELEAASQALMMTSRDHAVFYKAFTQNGRRDWPGP
jgi:hypothetical protein